MREILLQCAKVLWDFTRLDQIPTKSDVMILLGNDDPRSAEHAADLYLEGWANLVVISGKEGNGTIGKLPPNKTEADVFYEIMATKGVPPDKIVLEKEATNTGENIQYSQNLLRKMGIQPKSVLLITKSLMELRASLTFKKQWQGSGSVHLSVSSPPLSLLEYPSPHVGNLDEVVEYLVANFEKFTEYARLGHQAPVVIPSYVQRAHYIIVSQRKSEA